MADDDRIDSSINADIKKEFKNLFKEIGKTTVTLSSTNEAIKVAVKEYGTRINAENKALTESKQEHEKARLSLSRLRASYGQYSSTISGIIAIGISEIDTAITRKNTVEAEVNRIQALVKIYDDEIAKRTALIKDAEILSAMQSGDIGVINELSQARKEELARVNSEIEVTRRLISEKEDEVALARRNNSSMRSRLADTEDMLAVLELTEQEQGSLSEEDKRQKRQLLTAQQNLRSGLEEGTQYLKSLVEELPELQVGMSRLEVSAKKLEQDLEDLGLAAKSIDLKGALTDLLGQLNSEKWQIVNKIGKLFADLAKAISGLEQIIRKTQNQFGIAAGQAANLKLTQLGAAISSAITTFTSFGKRAAVSMEEIQAAQIEFQKEFGGVISSGAAADLARQAKEMGVSVAEMANARRAFLTTTLGDVNKAIDQQERAIASFEAKGLTAKDAMEFIGNNAELVARAGIRFQDSLMKAAATAKKIRVDLNKVNQVGDNIIGNFEGFLESMAELGAMGFGFDASALAELAETGDTSALFEELRSQLMMTGKDLTDLRRSEQLQLSQAFGMNIADFQRMAGIEVTGGGESMEDLQKTSNGFLERITNILGSVAGVMSAVNTILSISHTVLLTKILSQLFILTSSNLFNNITGGARTGGVGTLFRKGAASLPRGARMAASVKPAGILGGITSIFSGISEYKESGSIKRALGRSLANFIGTLVGGALGSLLPLPGIGTMIGAAAGGFLGNKLFEILAGDDVISRQGYGKRTLVTENGAVALNNRDTVVAYADDMISNEAESGVRMLPLGSLTGNMPQTQPNVVLDTSRLEKEVIRLGDRIEKMQVSLDGIQVGKVIFANQLRASQQVAFRDQGTRLY